MEYNPDEQRGNRVRRRKKTKGKKKQRRKMSRRNRTTLTASEKCHISRKDSVVFRKSSRTGQASLQSLKSCLELGNVRKTGEHLKLYCYHPGVSFRSVSRDLM